MEDSDNDSIIDAAASAGSGDEAPEDDSATSDAAPDAADKTAKMIVGAVLARLDAIVEALTLMRTAQERTNDLLARAIAADTEILAWRRDR